MIGFAIVLLGIGIYLVIPRREPPAPPREVVVAAESADTYSILSTEVMTREAALIPNNAHTDPVEGTVFISRGPIREGQILSYDNAARVGGPWRPGEMRLEILSFPADFDKMVAGNINPGHRVNIYAYNAGNEALAAPVRLIASNVWVVDARTARGAEAAEAQEATPEAEEEPAGFLETAAQDQVSPASIVTVAAEPDVIWRIVDILGAKQYRAWVTLAGTQQPITPTPSPTPTPTPTLTPTPMPTATPAPTETPTGVSSGEGEDGAVIHVVLLDWYLDIVSPDDLEMIPTTTGEGFTFDYPGRQLTLEVRNSKATEVWAERQDQDDRARVVIAGKQGERVWFEPGQEGTITIELLENFDEATVVLIDSNADVCLEAVFLADVTLPDGTRVDRNQTFEKTWRVRNNGTCAWPADTVLDFFEGDRMDAPDSVRVGTVEPDEVIEVSVELKAPDETGKYASKWRLRTSDGFFGQKLTVSIQVVEGEG